MLLIVYHKSTGIGMYNFCRSPRWIQFININHISPSNRHRRRCKPLKIPLNCDCVITIFVININQFATLHCCRNCHFISFTKIKYCWIIRSNLSLLQIVAAHNVALIGNWASLRKGIVLFPMNIILTLHLSIYDRTKIRHFHFRRTVSSIINRYSFP